MKKIISLILAALSAVLLTTAVSAINEKIYGSHATPVVDGYKEKIWDDTQSQKLGWLKGGDGSKSSADSQASISFLWDRTSIYFLIEIEDKDLTAYRDDLRCDSVYIYIDEKDAYSKTWVEGQTKLALFAEEGKSLFPMEGDEPDDWEMSYKYTDDTHLVFEVKYTPKAFLPRSGQDIRCDFQYNDFREDGTLAYVYGWSDEIGEVNDTSASWSYISLREKAGTGSRQSDGVYEAAASIGRDPIESYTFISGTGGNPNEGPESLWDGNVETKFCSSEFPMRSIVELDKAYRIDGVIMATANDNASYNGRNPNEWKIQGSNNASDWEDIITGNESFFDEVNFTYFAAGFDPTEKAYKYIRFRNGSSKSGCCQVSEVVVCSTPVLWTVQEDTQPETEEIIEPAEHFESKELRRKALAAEEKAETVKEEIKKTDEKITEKKNLTVPTVICLVLVFACAAGVYVWNKKKQ